MERGWVARGFVGRLEGGREEREGGEGGRREGGREGGREHESLLRR